MMDVRSRDASICSLSLGDGEKLCRNAPSGPPYIHTMTS